jgi:uncharacterized protein (TIGR02145 family)
MKNFAHTGICLLIFVVGISCTKRTSINPNTVKDIDGNVYKTVTIGNQTWMAENLRTTKYRNGEPIVLVTDPLSWTNTNSGAYRGPYYADKLEYGNFYNWYAVGDPRNIAPEGWHVPTDADYTELATFLGGNGVAGSKLKEVGTSHWAAPNTDATNETGFSALGAALINGTDGNVAFTWLNTSYVSWTSTLKLATNYPYIYKIDNINGKLSQLSAEQLFGAPDPKKHGCTVRCVKDK